jgi:ankyrin repeat protein
VCVIKFGHTAVMQAAEEGNTDVVKMLLEAKVELNPQERTVGHLYYCDRYSVYKRTRLF